MKGIIICPEVTTKYLISINKKLVIDYAISNMLNIGIKDIFIVFRKNDIYSKDIRTQIEKYSHLANIHYSPKERIKTIPEEIMEAKFFIEEDDFVLSFGDTIIIENITAFKPPHIYLSHSDRPSSHDIVEFYSEKLNHIEHKPEKPKSKFAVNRLYIYPNSVFEYIRKKSPKNIIEINKFYIRKFTYSFLEESMMDIESVESIIEIHEKVRLRELRLK